ncbi:MAG TPA: FG-GAP-like repeat-containing protein [Gemmatimonadaceae bacterium]
MKSVARLAAAFALVMIACTQKEVRPEELFQAQSLGLAYLETGQLAPAESAFKKVIALAPRDAAGYANLGVTYLRGSRFSDAEAQLKHARELDPANADIALSLAKVYAVTGRSSEARSTLDGLRRADPRNPHAAYALAELDKRDSTAAGRYVGDLHDVMSLSPTNLAVRVQLIDAYVRGNQPDSAVRQLEEVRRIGPELPPDARAPLDSTIQLLRLGKVAAAREPLDRFLHAMELTSSYQASLDDVKWLEGPLTGRPVLSFTPKSIAMLRGLGGGRGKPQPDLVRFSDVTAEAKLPELVPATASPVKTPGAIAVGDFDGDGIDDLFLSIWSPQQQRSETHLYRIRGREFTDVAAQSGLALPNGANFATFVDVDNDGHLDLFTIGGDQRAHLFHNDGKGKFQDVTAASGIANLGGATRAMFVDLDHDGDLDLVLVGGPSLLFYRNNADGTFTEMAGAVGLTASIGTTNDAAFADFDDDGRMDLLVVGETGAALYHNAGNRQLTNAIASSGIKITGGSAVAVGDYNNDGAFDVFAAGTKGGPSTLWLNDGRGGFRRDSRSDDVLKTLATINVHDVTFADFDNDGFLDLIVVGDGGVRVLRNDGTGRFVDRSSILPAALPSATSVIPADVDGDGDQDLLLGGPTGVRLLRNLGANGSLSMQVQLVGLRTGSGKNNDFGIGAKVEVRAADLYQTRVITSRITSFGLGPHLKADVIRVEWPNGVPQTVYFPGSDQDVLENEVLKGSCAFLYTWDGSRYRFVTDVMWRSALGMPLGLLGSNTSYAPAGASQEYLRIPASALKAKNGKYVMQLTEELWETAYADHLKLLAVDHPDSVDVFVDERFVPPGPVELRPFFVTRRELPRSAVDERGNDVLDALRATDDKFVTNLTPLQYQGLVEPHDLILDLGPDAGRDSSFLFLRGWIYPTDASINVALSQQTKSKTMMPSLEVRDATGAWRTAIANLSFPSGKDKTLIVDLAHIFLTPDRHVRIRTNLQIYWDEAFVALSRRDAGARITTLDPVSADLHPRGYSRTYRKGGRYGPWWFDYDSVSREPRWRPIEGAFTRFGDVLPLLGRSDDMYVIMAPGDEMTLQFDAGSEKTLPRGWTRDFLLYTDGWIKDSDLNTAFGTSVEPLPFHAIKQYPYAPGESYPTDSAHQRYRRDYNTRIVTRAEPGRRN